MATNQESRGNCNDHEYTQLVMAQRHSTATTGIMLFCNESLYVSSIFISINFMKINAIGMYSRTLSVLASRSAGKSQCWQVVFRRLRVEERLRTTASLTKWAANMPSYSFENIILCGTSPTAGVNGAYLWNGNSWARSDDIEAAHESQCWLALRLVPYRLMYRFFDSNQFTRFFERSVR